MVGHMVMGSTWSSNGALALGYGFPFCFLSVWETLTGSRMSLDEGETS